jgi:hypothetical protein
MSLALGGVEDSLDDVYDIANELGVEITGQPGE